MDISFGGEEKNLKFNRRVKTFNWITEQSAPINEYMDNTLAMFNSLFSLVLGLLTIFLATLIYFRNRKTINSQTFHSSHKVIVYMTTVICLMIILFTVYYFFVVK